MKALKSILSLSLSAVLIATIVSAVPVSAVTIATPIENSFFWLGVTPYPITGGIGSDVQSIQFQYLHRISLYNNYTQLDDIQTLYPSPVTHSFSLPFGNLEQNYHYDTTFPFPHFYTDGTQCGPYLKVTTTYTSGTSNTQYIKFSYIYKDRDFYEDRDSTFYYHYFGDNSFVDTATGSLQNVNYAYNCLAYAFNHSESGWAWDSSFDSNIDNRNAVISYIATNYGCTQNTNPYHAGATAIAYGTNNHVAHFAKVDSWQQSTGEPKTISSKWGGLEVIESQNTNPFLAPLNYGSPLIYFNSP